MSAAMRHLWLCGVTSSVVVHMRCELWLVDNKKEGWDPHCVSTGHISLIHAYNYNGGCNQLLGNIFWVMQFVLSKWIFPFRADVLYIFFQNKSLFHRCVSRCDVLMVQTLWTVFFTFDVYGSVHHNTHPIEMTNKMQLCRDIYYFMVSWLLNMFGAIISLEIRWAVKEQRNNKLSYTCWSFL
jgi:hypothetical protein